MTEENPHALAQAALKAAGVLWIELPGQRPQVAWHAFDGTSAVVVSGPGEQQLPPLPAEVVLILKSKDTGARLTKVRATAEVLTEGSQEYDGAVDLLAGSRLNSTDDVQARWREQCTVTRLTPVGDLLEHPQDPSTDPGLAPVPDSPARTDRWKPWHVRGRRNTMRARRMAKRQD